MKPNEQAELLHKGLLELQETKYKIKEEMTNARERLYAIDAECTKRVDAETYRDLKVERTQIKQTLARCDLRYEKLKLDMAKLCEQLRVLKLETPEVEA